MNTQRQRGGHPLKTETEIGVMRLQARECQALPASTDIGKKQGTVELVGGKPKFRAEQFCFCSVLWPGWRPVVLGMWLPDQQHLGACRECDFPGSTPDLNWQPGVGAQQSDCAGPEVHLGLVQVWEQLL